MHIRKMIVMGVLLIGAPSAGAELYRWIDDNGVVTFKDTPPPATKKGRKVKVYADKDFDVPPPNQPAPVKDSAGNRGKTAAQPAPAARQRFSGTVEMYVTEWCGYCKQARAYMQRNGIPFAAYDIEKDAAAKQRHKELGGRGVPLIIIGTNRISGFSPDSFEQAMYNSR